jgi:hypothetical protein
LSRRWLVAVDRLHGRIDCAETGSDVDGDAVGQLQVAPRRLVRSRK